MQKEEKFKSLFHDIGKSTLRGVRKCPKCGTSNGMRGYCCKNRACDVVFKEAGEKRKQFTDVCKLATGSSTQVFSVRVRDRGPDYRGFVQLPLLQSTQTDSLMNETTALCFVDSCQRTFTTNVLKCHEKELPVDTTCQHIQATLRCYAEAQPLSLNNSVLYSLNFPINITQAVWQLAMETAGPFVQRVSKTVMVVKCKVTSKHPLGYLHVTFNLGNQAHYSCSCPSFKGLLKSTKFFARCIHYYACIAAFAGDEKLSEEFAYYVDQERPKILIDQAKPDEDIARIDDEESNQNQLVAILSDVVNNCEVEVEVLPEEAELLQQYTLADGITQDEDFDRMGEAEMTTGNMSELDMQSLEVVYPEPEITTLVINNNTFNRDILKINCGKQLTPNVQPNEKHAVKRKKDDSAMPLVMLQENTVKKPRKSRTNQTKPAVIKKDGIDESTVQQSFINWLSSVTERINQTMHFQFSGKPASLVFHTPQEFFECLRERISAGGFKRRLPNTTTAFIRKNAIPLGTFTKYTWHINNIIHCKQIFETPMMPLEITRSFVENRDGSYEPYVGSSLQDEAFSKLDNGPRIKPLELKTFLKVGRTTPDQKTPTPLIIEWIPDILPLSKVGELKISFEYGHRRP